MNPRAEAVWRGVYPLISGMFTEELKWSKTFTPSRLLLRTAWWRGVNPTWLVWSRVSSLRCEDSIRYSSWLSLSWIADWNRASTGNEIFRCCNVPTSAAILLGNYTYPGGVFTITIHHLQLLPRVSLVRFCTLRRASEPILQAQNPKVLPQPRKLPMHWKNWSQISLTGMALPYLTFSMGLWLAQSKGCLQRNKLNVWPTLQPEVKKLLHSHLHSCMVNAIQSVQCNFSTYYILLSSLIKYFCSTFCWLLSVLSIGSQPLRGASALPVSPLPKAVSAQTYFANCFSWPSGELAMKKGLVCTSRVFTFLACHLHYI